MGRTSFRIAGIACLIVGASAAHAVPVTFQFTATPQSFGYGYPSGSGRLAVPEPFGNASWVFGSQISGSFTVESGTAAHTTQSFIDGSWVSTGSYYHNPITQMSLDVGGQHFDFLANYPAAPAPRNYESGVSVHDLPFAASNPMDNHDLYDLDVQFGSGLLSGAFSHLGASFSMVRSEVDLGVITSRDMIENLVYTPEWNTFFSLFDSNTQQYYQIHAPLTSLTRVASVPEPGTALLLALGAGLAISRLGRRQRAAAR